MISKLFKSTKNCSNIIIRYNNKININRSFISTTSVITKSSKSSIITINNNNIKSFKRFYSNDKKNDNNNNNEYIVMPTSNNKEHDQLIKNAIEYTNESEYENAIRELNKAIQISPTDPKAYSLRADIYELLGRFDDAIQDYNQVLLYIPESIPCYSSLAACYSSKGDIQRAIKYFEQILIIDPNYIPANGYLGDIFLREGDLNKSLKYYKKVLSLEPNSPIGLLGLGHLAIKQGNVGDAMKIYRQVVKLGQDKPIEQFHTQVSATTEGPRITRSIEENPIYSACLCLAHGYYNQLKPEESMKYFEKVVEFNPRNSNAYAMMATLLLQQQEFEKALQYINKSIELEPLDFNLVIKADILFDLGRFEEAVPIFKQVLASFLEGESPDPEKAIPRLNILHNLLLSYAHLSSQFPLQIDFNSVRSQMTDLEIQQLVDKPAQPETLFELNAQCRNWVKFFERLSQSVYTSGTIQREFSDLMLEFLQTIALASSEMVQINHREMQNQSATPILSPEDSIDDMLFEYYENITNSILNDSDKK